MSSEHNTDYPVWPECRDHPEPDSTDDPRHECTGKSECQVFPLADWFSLPPERTQLAYVRCQGCITYFAEQDAWEATHDTGEATHDTGEGADGWSGIICKVGPPKHYCLECSEDEGDWIQHQDDEETAR